MKRAMASVLSCAVALAALVAAEAAAEEPATQPASNPRAELEIVQGDQPLGKIVIELDYARAPISVHNFVRYAHAGSYNGTIFHRVMPEFMIQGGGFLPDLSEKREGLHPGIENEYQNGLRNRRGTVAMARQGNHANSATAQFFINVVDNTADGQTNLDAPRDGAAYAVFGRVVEGMDVVDKIRQTPVKDDARLPMGKVVPESPVIIQSVKIVGGPDEAALAARAAEARTAHWKKLFAQLGIAGAEGKLTATESGLQSEVLRPGTGASPKPTDQVEVHYTGWLLHGVKFDSSRDRGESITFPLNGVIAGWTEGVGLMKVGERRILVIPPQLGYGPRGAPPRIPGNAPLIFEVELLGIK